MTYTTIFGQVLDLSSVSGTERVFLDRCLEKFNGGSDWAQFANLVDGNENPLIRPHGGLTRAVVVHPLYVALHDLANRLGISQGYLKSEGHPELPPLRELSTASG